MLSWLLDSPTESRGLYPHIVLIQSHISHVELGSDPPETAPFPLDRALIILLAALTALAAEGTRMFCGVTGMWLW